MILLLPPILQLRFHKNVKINLPSKCSIIIDMFSSHPSLFVPVANPDAAKLITAIRDQTEGTPPHMVYVLDIVSVRFGGSFTAEVRQEL